ncbi:hypothetical protein OY671_007659, partial [Metschnikowia pulcherrima]
MLRMAQPEQRRGHGDARQLDRALQARGRLPQPCQQRSRMKRGERQPHGQQPAGFRVGPEHQQDNGQRRAQRRHDRQVAFAPGEESAGGGDQREQAPVQRQEPAQRDQKAQSRRADHRPTFDVLFDSWFPPALGARFVEVDDDSVDIQDIDQVRDQLVDSLASDAGDSPSNSLIAQIVEAYGKYNSTRGTSYSAYQAMKSSSSDQIEAKSSSGVLGSGDDASPSDEAVAKAIAKQRISKVRQLVEAETKRRTAEQSGRERVTAYGVPQSAENVEFSRASGEQSRNMRR